jgi:hypothetical protein
MAKESGIELGNAHNASRSLRIAFFGKVSQEYNSLAWISQACDHCALSPVSPIDTVGLVQSYEPMSLLRPFSIGRFLGTGYIICSSLHSLLLNNRSKRMIVFGMYCNTL